MEELIVIMEEFISLFVNYGIWITVFALVGIVILGVLKYCNLFTKIEESKRHYIYIGISLGFSLIVTAIYLLIIKAFDWTYFFTVAAAMYALNQAFYNIFKVTPINKLAARILDWIVKLFKRKVLNWLNKMKKNKTTE